MIMAKPTLNDEDTRKKRPLAKGFSAVLFALMALSLLSFGVGGFGGQTTRLGQVGDQDIKVNDYVNSLRSTVDRFSQMLGRPVPMRDAIAAGMDKQALSELVARVALNDEMDKVGLSASDLQVATELGKVKAFQTVDGKFDRTAYAEALKGANLTENEYEKSLRADLARTTLQLAITGGVTSPDALTDTLFYYSGETRSFTWMALTEADLTTPLTAPTDADLTAEYDANIAAYTRPEAKRISYAALLPDEIATDMPVDEAALKTLFDTRKDQYNIPEKRLVERLVYPTDAEAAAAKAKLDAGTTFEALVSERKLTLADIDLGDVAKSDLGAAGDAVFAMTAPGVVGPVQSDLGPALFRMNAILPAQVTTFEQARPDLLLEMQTEAARKDIAARIEAIDDALAGGATLEELAKSENLNVKSIDYASGADDNDPIANYAAFRKALDDVAKGDFPAAIVLEDGGVVAMTMVDTVPPTPRPLADVKEKVTAAWTAKKLAEALTLEATAKLALISAGTDMATLGTVKVTPTVERNATVEGGTPALLEAAFAMQAGDVKLVNKDGFIAIVRLDAILPAKDNPKASEQRDTLRGQLAQSFASDIFDTYTKSIQADRTLTIDQSVIDAVHSQMGN
jgi:peptidyl-prolyl cis-trans isomerase D